MKSPNNFDMLPLDAAWHPGPRTPAWDRLWDAIFDFYRQRARTTSPDDSSHGSKDLGHKVEGVNIND